MSTSVIEGDFAAEAITLGRSTTVPVSSSFSSKEGMGGELNVGRMSLVDFDTGNP